MVHASKPIKGHSIEYRPRSIVQSTSLRFLRLWSPFHHKGL